MNTLTDNDVTIAPPLRAPKARDRTVAQLWEQYQVEKELAARLRDASPLERRKLYSSVYDELFRRIPHHSQLTDKVSPQQRAARISLQLRLLDRFLEAWCCSAGDRRRRLRAVAARRASRPQGLRAGRVHLHHAGHSSAGQLRADLSDGVSVPVHSGRITLAYSNQLMEHLHPQDAAEQLANIFKAHRAGRRLRLHHSELFTGPHDISRYFADTANGFHLQGIHDRRAAQIMRKAGFRRTVQYARIRGTYFRSCRAGSPAVVEALCGSLSARMRARVCRNAIARGLLDIRLAAWK